MKIVLGADHGGYLLKDYIREQLEAAGHEVTDLGVNDSTSVDYPDQAAKVCEAYLSGDYTCGLLFCGTGIGISIAANKIKGIRAAHVADAFSARMAREHNNANIICLGGRTLGTELAWSIVEAYLSAEFVGDRHQRRIDKITALEEQKE
ncbi:MAG: ribose 5-phosphate isomerase B [Eubacteriales bacterium]|nr:ribose 5-phosphate isomerase B [Eubacteriales bacterium]